MKKLFAIAALVLILVLVFHLVSFACEPPCPPPAECSAGFWKNHTEIWNGEGTLWLEILQAKGNSPLRSERGWVVSQLNAMYPYAPCD